MSRWRKILLWAAGAIVVVFLPWLDRFLCGGDLPEQADAVVVLAGGRYTTGRLEEGLRLLHAGYTTNLIVSGVEFDPHDQNFVSAARQLLAQHVVIIDKRSRITRDSSLFVNQLARERQWRRVLVVTSEFHWRRTRALFRYDRRTGLDIRVCTIKDVAFTDWWANPRVARLLRNELWFLITFYIFHTPCGIVVIVTLTALLVLMRTRRHRVG